MKQKILYMAMASILIFFHMTLQTGFADTLSDKTVSGFVHPESVACDTERRFYMWGSSAL